MVRAITLGSILSVAQAQMKGDVGPPDTHPKIIMQECKEGGSCTDAKYGIVLDMSWRWLHNVGGYTNCVGEDGKWADEYCPDGKTCAKQCCVEGLNSTQYSDTYGISAAKDASGVTLKYVPGSRVYLLDNSGDQYFMFKLKNKEFTFDIDLSTLPCGTNAALYLIEMAADGGGSDAGAAYGAGYCDAQCPRGAKFIDDEANTEDWGMSLAETPDYKWMEVGPEGKYGACCAEFDILEANNQALAITAHPCSLEGLKKCDGEEECGNKSAGEPGWCDKDGCGLNPYRMGEPNFYGPGSSFTIDTTKPFTVITQFITEDGTDDGDLVDIRRKYIQGGKVIDNAMAYVLDKAEQGNSLNDDVCTAVVKKFNVTKKNDKHHKSRKSRTWMDTYVLNGGTKAMGEAIGRGMVMSLSVWDDGLGRMNWLDSEKTLIDEDTTQVGVARGPCKFEDGDPKKLRADNKQAYVTFSNLKMGPIGSTFSNGGSSNDGGAADEAEVSSDVGADEEISDQADAVEDESSEDVGAAAEASSDAGTDEEISVESDSVQDNIGELVVTHSAEDADDDETDVDNLEVTDNEDGDDEELAPTRPEGPENVEASAPAQSPTPVPAEESTPEQSPTPVPAEESAPEQSPTPVPAEESVPEQSPMPEPSEKPELDSADSSASTASEATPGVSFTPTDGCEWIPDDNCQDVNDYACSCRESNPDGPCTPCNPTSEKKAQLWAIGHGIRRSSSSMGFTGAALLAVVGVSVAASAIAVARRSRSNQGTDRVLVANGDEEASIDE